MRATRELVGALGAGISLAIAGSLALLIVSSVIAFRGWPGDLGASVEPEIARLSAEPAPSSAHRAVVALPKAAPSTAAPARPRSSSPRAGSGPAQTPSSSTTASGTTAGESTSASSGPSPEGPAPSAPSAPSPRVAGPVHQAADAVRDTSTAVGEAVAPAAPAAGGALESVGAAGADTADKVGQAVDGVLP